MKQAILAFVFLLMATVVGAQQTVMATTAPCITAPYNAWTNIPFQSMSGSFEAQFDVNLSSAASDGVVTLYSGALLASYSPNTSVPIEFTTTGTILAYNGTTYTAVNTIKYTAGTVVHITLDVNLANHTYNAYVGTATRTVLATNYAFRTTGGTPTTLTAMGVFQDNASATNRVCNFTLLSYPVVTAHMVNLSWNPSVVPVGGGPVTSYTPERGASALGPWTPLGTTVGSVTSYTDENVVEGTTYWYTVFATNAGGKSGLATPVSVLIQ